MATINIVGTVGAGKTTMVKRLHEATGVPVGYEAQSEVLDKQTRDLLKKYYSNPKKYALEKNLFFLQQRLQTIQKNQNEPLFISDRSLYDDYLMALLNKRNGQLTDDEWFEYTNAFDEVEKYAMAVSEENDTMVIFMCPSFNTTLLNIKARGRQEELPNNNPQLVQYYADMYELYREIFEDDLWSNKRIILESAEKANIETLVEEIKGINPAFKTLAVKQ